MKIVKSPILTTHRLTLHAITDRDCSAVTELLTNEEVGKTYMLPDFKSREDVQKLFEALKRLSTDPGRFVYGIFLEDRLIGLINEVEKTETEIELGFLIHPRHKNNGFATEVLTTAIRVLLALGYKVVKTGAFEENLPSIRVMEKCRMTRLEECTPLEYRGQIHHCVWFEARP